QAKAQLTRAKITKSIGAGNRDRQVGRRRSSAPTPARPAGGLCEKSRKSPVPRRRPRLLQQLTVPYGLVRTDELNLQAACRTTPLGVLGQPIPLPVEEILVVGDHDDPFVPGVDVVGIPIGELGVQRPGPRQVAGQFGRAVCYGPACRSALVVAFG